MKVLYENKKIEERNDLAIVVAFHFVQVFHHVITVWLENRFESTVQYCTACNTATLNKLL